MPKVPKTTWYHGDRAFRTTFKDQQWDRDRTTSSLNEEGPGIYWTTDYNQAASYGPHVVETVLPSDFKLLPRKFSLSTLQKLYAEAEPEHQETFLSNWGEDVTRDEALRKYTHQNTFLDAAVSLYTDLFQYDATAWVNAMRSLGYDGVIVDKSYGVKHLIVWRPEKLVVHEAAPPYEENPYRPRADELIARLAYNPD